MTRWSKVRAIAGFELLSIVKRPGYLIATFGMPEAIDDLEMHNCLPTGDQDVWRLESPAGSRHIRPRGNIRSNCCDLTRA